MIKSKSFLFLFITALLCGCAASVSSSRLKSYQPTPQYQNIDVYGQFDNISRENEIIGTIEYDDTGFSLNCGYSDMLKSFIKETRKIGGNAVKITTVKNPDLLSTCYRGTANVLKYKTTVTNKQTTQAITSNKSTLKNSSEKSEEFYSNAKKAKKPTFVAILETTSGGIIKLNECQYLTNVLREEAVKILSTKLNYTIMTRENISAMLPPEKNIEDCEGTCLVETGRNISANYVAQARISTFGKKLTISVELYNSANGKLISSFNAKSLDLENLEFEIRQKASKMFREILYLESIN